MRWQLIGPWSGPRGIWFEHGTIIDGNDPGFAGVPLNAMALDQEAADYLARTYPYHLHELRAGTWGHH
jgi:hypothetical protein